MPPIDRSTRVGIVGLGNLGQAIALALLRDGWSLSVIDKDPAKAKPCVDEGAKGVGSLEELADCGAVALAVPDDDAVESVLEGSADDSCGLFEILTEGSIVVLHSTVLPRTAQRLADAAAGRGLAVLDAPVSGGSDRALRGDLTVMVGGGEDVVRRARPFLDAVGSEVHHVGPPGAGEATKLANQLMMFASLAATHEALDLAARYGVAESSVLAAVSRSTGDSWVARNWGFFDRVAAAYDEGETPVRERPWSKDLWEVCAAARDTGTSVPLAALLAQTLAERVEDHAAAVRQEGRE